MRIPAVIFDLDGTVLDDEEVYGAAFTKVLEGLGVKVKEPRPHKGGIGVAENWSYLLAKYKIKTTKSTQELSSKTQQEFIKLIGKVRLEEGFIEFVEQLKLSRTTVALATSNEWFVVEKILDSFNLENVFDVVTTGEEVTYKKPDPDLFINTARKLGVDSVDCIVFEDSPAGVEAAIRAGMRVVGVAGSKEDAKGLSGADLIITNYSKDAKKIADFLDNDAAYDTIGQ